MNAHHAGSCQTCLRAWLPALLTFPASPCQPDSNSAAPLSSLFPAPRSLRSPHDHLTRPSFPSPLAFSSHSGTCLRLLPSGPWPQAPNGALSHCPLPLPPVLNTSGDWWFWRPAMNVSSAQTCWALAMCQAWCWAHILPYYIPISVLQCGYDYSPPLHPKLC